METFGRKNSHKEFTVKPEISDATVRREIKRGNGPVKKSIVFSLRPNQAFGLKRLKVNHD